MSDHFVQQFLDFKDTAKAVSGFLVLAGHRLATALLGLHPVCIAYALVAVVLFYRALHFHRASQPEHRDDCALHALLAAFIAIVYQL